MRDFYLINEFPSSIIKSKRTMKHISKNIVLLCLYLFAPTLFAQSWERIASLPQTEFSALEIIDETIYAASANHLYVSSDSGFTWTQSIITTNSDIWITDFAKFNGRIYAGTSIGIFSVNIDAASNLWNHDLQTEQINSFTEKDGVFYASAEVFGVLRFTGFGWVPFNAGLPTYSMSVTEILDTPGGLMAIAGANGTFYRYSFTQNAWIEDYYFGNGFMAGIDVDDLTVVGDILYAARYNSVYRSDNLGETWFQDKQGLITGQTRTLHVVGNSLYSISMIGTNTTRFNKRNVAAAGSVWADAGTVPFLTYAFRELNGFLFSASAQGLYVSDTSLGTPDTAKSKIAVFPNPSHGQFAINSDVAVTDVKVYDATGRMLAEFRDNAGIREFSLQRDGIYIVSLQAGDHIETQKIIVR